MWNCDANTCAAVIWSLLLPTLTTARTTDQWQFVPCSPRHRHCPPRRWWRTAGTGHRNSFCVWMRPRQLPASWLTVVRLWRLWSDCKRTHGRLRIHDFSDSLVPATQQQNAVVPGSSAARRYIGWPKKLTHFCTPYNCINCWPIFKLFHCEIKRKFVIVLSLKCSPQVCRYVH